jgi:hypothetical protein
MNLSDYDFLIRFILAIFTCYRLARLISRDDGPGFVFSRLRWWAKDKAVTEMAQNDIHPELSDQWFGKWHNLSEALSCPYCLGVWFSIPLVLFVIYPMTVTDLFMLLMTISGVQAWLWGMVEK